MPMPVFTPPKLMVTLDAADVASLRWRSEQVAKILKETGAALWVEEVGEHNTSLITLRVWIEGGDKEHALSILARVMQPAAEKVSVTAKEPRSGVRIPVHSNPITPRPSTEHRAILQPAQHWCENTLRYLFYASLWGQATLLACITAWYMHKRIVTEMHRSNYRPW